jgi:hypothetical protein
MFYHCLFQGCIKPQDMKVMGNTETYVYKLRGILHAGVGSLDLFLFSLGFHSRQYVSTVVWPCLNEVGLSHRDSATCEYWRGCFLGLNTDGPSPDCCPPWAPSPKDLELIGDASWCLAGSGLGDWRVASYFESPTSREVGLPMTPVGTWVPSEPKGFDVFGGVLLVEGLGGWSTFGDSPSGWMSLIGEAEEMSWGTLQRSLRINDKR